MKNFTENTFWAKTKEEKLENPGFFAQLTKTFAAKSAPKPTESGDGLDKKATAKKKGKDLKIIDPKSAQNLCKCCRYVFFIISLFVEQTTVVLRSNKLGELTSSCGKLS